jgi:hypothetical protein
MAKPKKAARKKTAKKKTAKKKPRKTAKRKTAKPKAAKPKAAKPKAARRRSGGRKAAPAPTHEQIAARAQEIWVLGGCRPGTSVADWLQAERELSAPKA